MAGTEPECPAEGKPSPLVGRVISRPLRPGLAECRMRVKISLTPAVKSLQFHDSWNTPRAARPYPPRASPAAIAHITSPTATSSQTQAEAFAKTGASARAPKPSAVKKLSDAAAAATPNTA